MQRDPRSTARPLAVASGNHSASRALPFAGATHPDILPWALHLGAALVAALLAFSVAAPAFAQDRERLRSELETTQRILERAREVVEESGSPRALDPLRIAFRLQEEAVQMGRSDRPRDWMNGFERTLQARKLAQRAMSIAAEQVQLEKRAQQEIFKLENLIDRLTEHADTAPSERAQQIMEMAQRRLLQSRQAFHEQHFEEAYNLAHDTRRLLENLVPRQPARRFERMFENTQRLLERAREVVGSVDNAQAQSLLERAERQFEAARRTQSEGRPEAAFRHLTQARDLAMRSLRLEEGPVDATRLDKFLEDTQRYIDAVATRIDATSTPDAMTLLDNARQRLERARAQRTNGSLRESLAEARIARNLAQRALDMTHSGGL
jgi:hypothetical protein